MTLSSHVLARRAARGLIALGRAHRRGVTSTRCPRASTTQYWAPLIGLQRTSGPGYESGDYDKYKNKFEDGNELGGPLN
jgi:hypothetical protein